MRAAKRYDPASKVRFATFAGTIIQHSMLDAVARYSGVITLPVHIRDAHRAMSCRTAALAQELGRPPALAEVAAATGISVRRLRFLRTLRLLGAPGVAAGDAADGEAELEAKEELAEEVEDEGALVRDLDARLSLEGALGAALSPREREVVRLRFALGGGEPMSLAEIGRAVGKPGKAALTSSRVQVVLRGALSKLRSHLAPGPQPQAPAQISYSREPEQRNMRTVYTPKDVLRSPMILDPVLNF